MDNQTSMDGDNNGAFTGMLKKVWNGGKFTGNYRKLRDKIVAANAVDTDAELLLRRRRKCEVRRAKAV